MISREYAEEWFPDFVKKVDAELATAQERVDETLGRKKKRKRTFKSIELGPAPQRKVKTKCRGCGCAKDEATFGCKICRSRHFMRRKSATAHAKNL